MTVPSKRNGPLIPLEDRPKFTVILGRITASSSASTHEQCSLRVRSSFIRSNLERTHFNYTYMTTIQKIQTAIRSSVFMDRHLNCEIFQDVLCGQLCVPQPYYGTLKRLNVSVIQLQFHLSSIFVPPSHSQFSINIF